MAIGSSLEFDEGVYDVVLGGRGNLFAPGLIDSHIHVVLGDSTPYQHTIGFLRSYRHGGITRSLSTSEVHAPPRPASDWRATPLEMPRSHTRVVLYGWCNYV